MSNHTAVEDTGADDVFDIATSIRVVNAHLKLNVTITPTYLTDVDGTTFVHLECYGSRGVYALMACRLTVGSNRQHAKLLSKVVSELKKLRDDAFCQLVLSHVGDHSLSRKSFGVSVTKPRCKRLRSAVMALPDTIEVEVPPFSEEFKGFRLSCLSPRDRVNGNTELWVDSKPATWNFISKFVAHTQGTSTDDVADPGTPSTVDCRSAEPLESLVDTTDTNVEIDDDAAGTTSTLVCGEAARSSTVALSTPKRQTSLNSFFAKHAGI